MSDVTHPATPDEVNFFDADVQDCPYASYQVLRDRTVPFDDRPRFGPKPSPG